MKNDWNIYKEWCKQHGLNPSHYTSVKRYMDEDIWEDDSGNLLNESEVALEYSNYLGGYINVDNTDEPRTILTEVI